MKTPCLSRKTLNALAQVFTCYPELTQVLLYGSRATGNSTPRSDIDLATRGILDSHRLGRLALDLEESDILQKCDVHTYELISNTRLKASIDSEGIPIYQKSAASWRCCCGIRRASPRVFSPQRESRALPLRGYAYGNGKTPGGGQAAPLPSPLPHDHAPDFGACLKGNKGSGFPLRRE